MSVEFEKQNIMYATSSNWPSIVHHCVLTNVLQFLQIERQILIKTFCKFKIILFFGSEVGSR